MVNWKNEAEAREQIKALVADYYKDFKEPAESKENFKPGDRVSYASRVYDEKEMQSLTDAMLDFWLTTGRFSKEFEKNFAEWIGVKYAHLVNSGSSANLIAFSVLTAPELGDRQIKRGDEVITVACGFPTTITPILQYGAVPVFVDVTVPQYNIDVNQLEEALSDKTKAVMIAHTLGNPFDLKAVKAFCDKHNLWLVEDNCDALGTKYTIDGETKFTGTWGDIGTSSFYPPHHMTMGEGGAVYTNNPLLNRLILSYRDWGRDCICVSGQDNLCGHRWDGQFGLLPKGYDHKYTYSHFGYNLKVTDLQAAVGVEQLKKFPSFIERRKHNWARLHAALEDVQDKIILPEPAENSDPSWFGFLISVRDFRGIYTGITNCTMHKPEVEADLYTKNKIKFMTYAGAYWGFMSSYICNTARFNKIKNPERYYGTYWLQSYIHALCATGDNTALGVIKGPCIGAGIYVNTTNFDSALVNGVYYKKLIDFMINENGFNKKQLEALYAKRLCHLSRHDILKEKSAGIHKLNKRNLFVCTNKYPEAWLTVYPLFIIPDLLCKTAVKLYRRLLKMNGEVRVNRPE